MNGSAKANLFRVPGGYTVPVTFSGKAGAARLEVRGIGTAKELRAAAWHPGATTAVPLKLREQGQSIVVDVPLRRGCAMVIITR